MIIKKNAPTLPIEHYEFMLSNYTILEVFTLDIIYNIYTIKKMILFQRI